MSQPLLPPPPPPAPVTKPAQAGKKWLVGGAIAAGVIVGSVGAAIGGANRADAEAAPAPTVTVAAAAEVTPAPSPTPEPVAQPAVFDAAAFHAQAGSHLDDMNKDLDDMVVTVQEQGFWRLLSNSLELSFNLGQLEALDVPTGATGWTGSLDQLDASLAALSDAVSTEDPAQILAAIDATRAQVEASRGAALATS